MFAKHAKAKQNDGPESLDRWPGEGAHDMCDATLFSLSCAPSQGSKRPRHNATLAYKHEWSHAA